MPISRTKLARKFAQRIRKAFSSQQFRKMLLKATPGFEHKAVAKEIEGYLNGFMRAEEAHSALPQPLFDWEGKFQRGQEQERYYPILGIWSFPDAAVLAPFKCAFEFDREPSRPGSHFKAALMKASVHVLSGAYEACVLVYILQPGPSRRSYLDDKSAYTKKLIETLQTTGLYVTLIRNRSV
jgi:hypothetical protein